MIMHCPVSSTSFHPIIHMSSFRDARVDAMAKVNEGGTNPRGKLPKNLRYPRRTKHPPDFGVNLFLKNLVTDENAPDSADEVEDEVQDQEPESEDGSVVWGPDEIEAISSLFQSRIPQKPGKLGRDRALPLSLPHKLRPLGLPTSKKNIKAVASFRASVSKQVQKDPNFLISLAREIKGLPLDADVSLVLNKWASFLRKGSLSLTIRELGHMGLPERALQTFCWAQNQSHLFPDDRILASTIQVLARHHELKVPYKLDKFITLASKNVIEAMVKGFIEGGWLNLAWKFLLIAKHNKRMLDSSVYVKMVLELANNPDSYHCVTVLLDELKERENLSLSQQDCTAVMKICVKMGRFEVVESLFNWFKQSGKEPSVLMYTTIIHSRYSEKKYREALAVVWEMEESNCLLDLPAYRVAIKLFVALNDVSRATRYYSKLKEAGFFPTYDIYRDMISVYMTSERLAKCREICKEVEAAGLRLDKDTSSRLLQLKEQTRSVYCVVRSQSSLFTPFWLLDEVAQVMVFPYTLFQVLLIEVYFPSVSHCQRGCASCSITSLLIQPKQSANEYEEITNTSWWVNHMIIVADECSTCGVSTSTNTELRLNSQSTLQIPGNPLSSALTRSFISSSAISFMCNSPSPYLLSISLKFSSSR